MDTDSRKMLGELLDDIPYDCTVESKIYTVGDLMTALEGYDPTAEVGVFGLDGGGRNVDLYYYEEANKLAIIGDDE